MFSLAAQRTKTGLLGTASLMWARKYTLAALAVLSIVGVLTFEVQASSKDDPLYPLYCSYGLDLGFAFESVGGSRPRGTPEDSAMVEFRFEPATVSYSAGRNELRPGQCTWLDRTMTRDEPKVVRLYMKGLRTFRMRGTGDRRQFLLTGPTKTRNGRDAFEVLYSMPAEEGVHFTLNARRAVDRYGRNISVVHDYLYANNISTVAFVEVREP